MRRWVLPCLLLVSALLAVTVAYRDWNFDCVAYAGAARAWLGQPSSELHTQVYAELERAAPARDYQAITSASPYRVSLHQDADRFAAQLPFYFNKPGYVALIAVASLLGASSVVAAFWVSAVAYAALSVVFVNAMLRSARAAIAWAVSLCLLLSPPLLEIGRIATPDALSALLCFSGVALVLIHRRPRFASALLVTSVLVRPDNVLFCGAVLVWMATYGDARQSAIAGLLGSAAALAFSALVLPAYSWSALFVHTFVTRLTTSAEAAEATLTLRRYVEIVREGMAGQHVPRRAAVLVFGLVTFFTHARSRSSRPRGIWQAEVALSALVWASALLHFLAFPMLADRFFAAHYLTIVTIAVLALERAAAPAGLDTSSVLS